MPMRSSPPPARARAFRIGATPARARAAGRRAPRDHLGGRERPAAHLSVRSRARPRALSGAVRAGRRRARRGHPLDLRAGRRDAAAAAQSAGHGSGRRSTPIGRASPPTAATTASISAACSWLGRDRDISTAVSARAFRDVRQAPPSRARAEYLGFGENEPARGYYLPAAAARAARGRVQPGCTWSLAAWNRPISARELVTAGDAVARGRPGEAEIVTGAAFTDTAITARDDLDRLSHPPFRHPRPGHAAAARMPGAAGAADQLRRRRVGRAADLRRDFRPAGSTPTSSSSPPATPPAGRAPPRPRRRASPAAANSRWTGWCAPSSAPAGGWSSPATGRCPTIINATERLISGLFTAPPGTGTAGALRRAAARADGRAPTPRILIIGRASRWSATAPRR